MNLTYKQIVGKYLLIYAIYVIIKQWYRLVLKGIINEYIMNLNNINANIVQCILKQKTTAKITWKTCILQRSGRVNKLTLKKLFNKSNNKVSSYTNI